MIDGSSEQVVVFLVRDIGNGREVCLAPRQQKDRIAHGCLNGYGGKIMCGETADAAALRELKEESGIEGVRQADIREVARVAVLWHRPRSDFGTVQPVQEVLLHVFIVEGDYTPRATAEMGQPEWHAVSTLPLDRLFPGDACWLPYAVEGQLLDGEIEHTGDEVSCRFTLRPLG